MPKRPVGPNSDEVSECSVAPALVREELERIVVSRYFRTSRRAKEFLRYVVEQKISGKGDLLKERSIGVQLFGRKPDYATGEDPVVRVEAGDVRRRLELYYASSGEESGVQIQIPLGSYVPVFRMWQSNLMADAAGGEALGPLATSAEAAPTAVEETAAAEECGGGNLEQSAEELELSAIAANDETGTPGPAFDGQTVVPATEALPGKRTAEWKRGLFTGAAASSLATLFLVLMGLLLYAHFHQPAGYLLKEFWKPAAASSKPVLLCVSNPVVYKPSDKLFEQYERAHGISSATRAARRNQVLPLAPGETIQWGDMVAVRNAGPATGGVAAAIRISKLLAELGIPYKLRFGDEATYAEVRDSPVVIVGSNNTEWAAQLTSGLNIIFDDIHGAPNIHETGGARRVWTMTTSSDGRITRDYGLITRQQSGRAGEFLVQVAGITDLGTDAASEFLAHQKEFLDALHSASVGFDKKNLQIVVATDVTNGKAGPPHAVAVSAW